MNTAHMTFNNNMAHDGAADVIVKGSLVLRLLQTKNLTNFDHIYGGDGLKTSSADSHSHRQTTAALLFQLERL